jgi:uncharacterized protein YcfJ
MKKITAMMMTLIFGLSIILTATPIAATTTNSAKAVQTRNGFLIPDNTLLEARLNQRLQARLGDGTRFTMTVQSPRQFRGAVIEGYVEDARRSGRVSGRSEIVLNFDRIRHRGRTYDFAGTIEDVRTTKGERVEVDREGSVREDSQTERTVGRSVGGAVIGTVIGAIAGGGSGAAKGAIIGGGLGAGSVLVQGRNNLDLRKDTRFTLRASAPR